jgi:hypothetical protein
MGVSAEIWDLYLNELEEIAGLDRAYYLTEDATTEARREYFNRQQRLEVLRVELRNASRTAESTESQHKKSAELVKIEAGPASITW